VTKCLFLFALLLAGCVAAPAPLPTVEVGATQTAAPTVMGAPDAQLFASLEPGPSLSPTIDVEPAPSPSASPPTGPAIAAGTYSVAALLDLLPVAIELRTGYDRDLFETWIDANGDGCNARKEVLLRDAVVAPTVGAKCALTGGQWVSPYDGQVFNDASLVQIDHVVALAEAWDSGASMWDSTRRTLFANDLSLPWSLLGVSGATNEDKGDKDPADWLPPRSEFVCTYLGDWLSIKVTWRLAIDQREKDAIAAHAECAPTTTRVSASRP